MKHTFLRWQHRLTRLTTAVGRLSAWLALFLVLGMVLVVALPRPLPPPRLPRLVPRLVATARGQTPDSRRRCPV